MTKLKPCPVCGNRVDILYLERGHEDKYTSRTYFFSHHPVPFGFCILFHTLDGKLFNKSKMENLARIWNIRGEECHTIGHLSEVEKVDFE